MLRLLLLYVVTVAALAAEYEGEDVSQGDMMGMTMGGEYEWHNMSSLGEEDYYTSGDIGGPEYEDPLVGTYTYVPMAPFPVTPIKFYLSVEARTPGYNSVLRSIAGKMKAFTERMSRGRVRVTTRTGIYPVSKPPGFQYMQRLVYIPGIWSRVPFIGNAITAKHELFHQGPMKLGHSHTRLYTYPTVIGSSAKLRDPFDPMTLMPGVPSLNPPHLHSLGWFGPTEEAYLVPGITYTLHAINDGSWDSKSLKSLLYQTRGGLSVWFSYVVIDPTRGWKVPVGMPGTAIATHESINQTTYFEGIYGKNPGLNVRTGLAVNVIYATKAHVRVNFTLALR